MGRPFLLAQISDLHIGARWGDGDPVLRLTRVIDELADHAPDAVLVSGDLVDTGAPAEYDEAVEHLGTLGVPIHPVAGNHDDRAALRACFGFSGDPGDPIQYVVELGGWRLVVLDSTTPGADHGTLDGDRLEWLADTLDTRPGAPALIALHHPPVHTGVPAWDAIGLAAESRRELEHVLQGRPQVKRIVSGHLHHAFTAELVGRPVIAAPSTYVALGLDFQRPDLSLAADPPGFLVHALADTAVSYALTALRGFANHSAQ